MTKTIKRIALAVAAIGILLALTEKGGGPWAGTIIGAVLCAVGFFGARMWET